MFKLTSICYLQAGKYLNVLNPANSTKIIYVRQFKTKGTNTATYDVQMDSVTTSAEIREAFGAFFKGKKRGSAVPPLPKELTKISINNSHTFQTRVRVRIMKQLATCHQAVNTDLSCFVTSYHPRPLLKIRHPSGKVDAFSFVESIRRFSQYLTDDFRKAETTYAKGVGLDKLIPTFLVLTPDLIQPSITHTPGSTTAVKRTAEMMEGSTTTFVPAKKGKGKRKGKGKQSGASGVVTRSGDAPSGSVPTSNPFEVLASPAVALESSFTTSQPNTITTDPVVRAASEKQKESSEDSSSMSE